MKDEEVVWFVTEEERNMHLEDINNEPRTESLEFMGIKVLKDEELSEAVQDLYGEPTIYED